MKQRLVVIDVETTGLDPKTCGIAQIAGQILELDTQYRTLTFLEAFNWDVKPFPNDVIEDAALKVTGRTKELLATYTDPKIVRANWSSILSKHCDQFNPKDKMYFVGYNVQFDYQFVRTWWEKCGDKYFGSYFYYPPLDVLQLAGYHLLDMRNELPNFQLATVTGAFGVTTTSRLHNAITDVELTVGLLHVLISSTDMGWGTTRNLKKVNGEQNGK